MNLHNMVRGAIRSVNPDIACLMFRSIGYQPSSDKSGTRIPVYRQFNVMAQIQTATYGDIQRLNAMGIQGVLRSVYLYGNWHGIRRTNQQGGDILQFPQETYPNSFLIDENDDALVTDSGQLLAPDFPIPSLDSWLIVDVAETFPQWCRVIVQLQNNPTITVQ